MVSYLRSIVFGIGSGKRLIYRDFLEEGDRENLEQCVERGVEGEAFLDDCDKDVDRDGDPDLGLHGIFGCPEEPLDPQMLLDPFVAAGNPNWLVRNTSVLLVSVSLKRMRRRCSG